MGQNPGSGFKFNVFGSTTLLQRIFSIYLNTIPVIVLYFVVSSTRGPALLKENSILNRSQARSEKPGGPPTTSLLGSMSSPGYGGGTPGRYGTPGRLEMTPTLATASSQAQDLGGQDPLATWVTVFGFPPAAASFVLSQVQRHFAVLYIFKKCCTSVQGLDPKYQDLKIQKNTMKSH